MIEKLFTLARDVVPVAASRIACKIVIGNREISYGFNSRKTDPFQKKYGKNKNAICIHSEVMAIKNALKRLDQNDLKNATLYIARAKKIDGKFVYGLARPCLGCQRAIAAFNIKNVVYSCDNGEIETL